MGKNLVVFSDGTGQEGGVGENTNVYKLFNMVEDRTASQIAFYDQGLGTGKTRKLLGKATGYGIKQNILECYTFLFENYQAGDRIYLFGLSRGATTVRSLSGFVHLFGMLPKSRNDLIEQAYDIYTISDDVRRRSQADEFIARHHTMWCKIKFLGVWDTVAALGTPSRAINVLLNATDWFKHEYHDLKLSESVEHAYHALAIDDERQTFHPVLWDSEISDKQTMKQVWFCGMHTDVGGGYPSSDLSDIPLEWMTGHAVRHGLRLYPQHKIRVAGNVNGTMHDSRGSFITRLYRQKVRFWPEGREDRPCVHNSVMQRTRNRHNSDDPSYRPWVLDVPHDVD